MVDEQIELLKQENITFEKNKYRRSKRIFD